uniref:heavy-metal-associated domain-containing protein n=1 Tax=Desertihabitans aurantiacus TaxID=2282477 RepID=UPI0018E5966F
EPAGHGEPAGQGEPAGHGDEHTGGPATGPAAAEDHAADGLARAADGYRLDAVSAPEVVGREGVLGLTVRDPDGRPLTGYQVSHEKELHLVVVRTDGAFFRHVHPVRDADGRWSLPWRWEAAGSYRLYADFVPRDGSGLTLSTLVQVGGSYDPRVTDGPVRTAEVDGYQVRLDGTLSPGTATTLTATVTRDGSPVTRLEPYLGAFGHLVALRDGDLAYLHVHPHGDVPAPGDRSGPEIAFEATAPTPGRYLLYLDLKIDGRVRTAAFVLDTDGSTGSEQGEQQEQDESTGHDEEEGADHGHDG